LRYKLVAQIDREVFGRGLTRAEQKELRAAAVAHFLRYGEEMEGVHLIGSWKNPANRNPLHANWKSSDDDGQSLEGFFTTIHGARRKDWGAALVPRKPVQSVKRAAAPVAKKAKVKATKKAQAERAKLKAKEAKAKAALKAKAQAVKVKEKAQAAYQRERDAALAKAKETIAKAKAKAQAKVQAAKLKAKAKRGR
jgi:colicin import membrane protein